MRVVRMVPITCYNWRTLGRFTLSSYSYRSINNEIYVIYGDYSCVICQGEHYIVMSKTSCNGKRNFVHIHCTVLDALLYTVYTFSFYRLMQ